jgi:OFA family oxalate/formate antiporter-like MFS transporter
MKRWIVLFAGLVLQSILGGIYAWSTFVPALTATYKLTNGQCGAIFGLTIAVFSIAMIFAGRFMSKYGPRITAMIGGLLFTTGYIVSSFTGGSFILLLLSYGLLVGTGIGFGYVCPLTIGMKWFPENRGLVTGVAVAGFGGGAIILSSLADYLLQIKGFDVLEVFFATGIGFGSLAILSGVFMSEPEDSNKSKDNDSKEAISQHIFSRTFILIFLGMFAGTFAGLLVVGNLKPFMLEREISDFYATLSISLFALGNILGRILWGQLHDRWGSRSTIITTFSLFVFALILLAVNTPVWVLMASTIMVGAGFGGCFVIFASTIVEEYQVKLFSHLYPICFLAYGLAALIGPSLGGWLADSTGSYVSGILTSIIILVLSLASFSIFFKSSVSEQTENQIELLKACD